QDMYNLLGVPKEDTAGKLKQFARNFQFFDAPVGLIFTIDKQMQQGQFVDLGLFMANVMLLARQHGLDTCPQEAWAIWPNTIRELLDIPESELVFCGMGLGWADDEALINSLETKRADVDEFALFHGFETVKAAE
ncbi:MAG: nitroreductase, partial [Alphaproteobacteria bacterium]|nr:nitroreductase [Alphaproteobacteria bacterium]